MVVDQPASIGALPLAVARDMGCPVAYLPGLTMRWIADVYPGEDETIAELEMIVGFDDDLAGEATLVATRLPGLPTQIHPSPDRVLGPRLQHPAVLTLLDRFGSPAQIRKAGRRRLVHAAAAEGSEDGRPAGRGYLRRAGRADRHRAGHRVGRADRPEPRRLAHRRP
ncbi:Mobile element protein [Streptomyces venezuelae]|nr:Mobile element protein [Streptomyces venezuelae]